MYFANHIFELDIVTVKHYRISDINYYTHPLFCSKIFWRIAMQPFLLLFFLSVQILARTVVVRAAPGEVVAELQSGILSAAFYYHTPDN